MKQIQLTAALLLFTVISYGQYVNETSKWFVISGSHYDQNFHNQRFQMWGDSTVNGITYNKLHWEQDVLNLDQFNGDTISHSFGGQGTRLLRIDSTGMYTSFFGSDELVVSYEYEIGDTLWIAPPNFYSVIDEIDILDIDGEQRKKIHFSDIDTYIYEGIGTTFGLLENQFFGNPELFTYLKCYFHNDVIYQFDTPFIPNHTFTSCEDVVFKDLSITTSIRNSTFPEENISISPNPFDDELIIQLEIPILEHLEINLYNLNGSLVKRYQSANTSKLNLNTSDINSGSYILEVKNGNVVDRKLVIKL